MLLYTIIDEQGNYMKKEAIFKILLITLLLISSYTFITILFQKVNFKNKKMSNIESLKIKTIGKDFQREVKEKGETKYIILGKEISEENGLNQIKELKIIIPQKEGKFDEIESDKGSFAPNFEEGRIYEKAQIKTSEGIIIESDGFRLVDKNKIETESTAKFKKDDISGSAWAAYYLIKEKVLVLEGDVILTRNDQSFLTSKIELDLLNHSGKIPTAITIKQKGNTFNAPSAQIVLNENNSLKEIFFNGPCSGEIEDINFVSSNGHLSFNHEKSVFFNLIGNVKIKKRKEPFFNLSTETIIFFKENGKNYFKIPQKLVIKNDEITLKAEKGEGQFLKNGLTGILLGPITAEEKDGFISSEFLEIHPDFYLFKENVSFSTKDGFIDSQKIYLFKDGRKRAEGECKGKLVDKNNKEIFFMAQKIEVSTRLYPIKLLKNVVIFTDKVELKGEEFTIISKDEIRGCKGVTLYSVNKEETIYGEGKELLYSNNIINLSEEAAIQTIKEKIFGKERIKLLYENNLLKKLIADKEVIFENEKFLARCDHLEYNPQKKEGKLTSKGKNSMILEKISNNISLGEIIEFSSSFNRIEIYGEGKKSHRGKIEYREGSKK